MAMDKNDIHVMLVAAKNDRKPVNVILKNGTSYSGAPESVTGDGRWSFQLLSIVERVTFLENEITEVAWL